MCGVFIERLATQLRIRRWNDLRFWNIETGEPVSEQLMRHIRRWELETGLFVGRSLHDHLDSIGLYHLCGILSVLGIEIFPHQVHATRRFFFAGNTYRSLSWDIAIKSFPRASYQIRARIASGPWNEAIRI